MSAQINRRALIGAVPAFGFSLAAVQAGAEPVTPVMALFAEWKAAKTALDDTDTLKESDPRRTALGKRWMEIEAQLENTPALTMQDLAAKIAAVTSFGQADLPYNDGESLMWREIVGLVA